MKFWQHQIFAKYPSFYQPNLKIYRFPYWEQVWVTWRLKWEVGLNLDCFRFSSLQPTELHRHSSHLRNTCNFCRSSPPLWFIGPNEFGDLNWRRLGEPYLCGWIWQNYTYFLAVFFFFKDFLMCFGIFVFLFSRCRSFTSFFFSY